MTNTNDIAALANDSALNGDTDTFDLCQAALNGDYGAQVAVENIIYTIRWEEQCFEAESRADIWNDQFQGHDSDDR